MSESDPPPAAAPGPASTPLSNGTICAAGPAKAPSSAMTTAGILFTPAILCFAIGWLWGNSSGINAAVALVLVAILGSLASGICGGIRIARRFAGPNGTNVGVAIGLSFLCIGASAIACFGGCLTGLYSGR